MFLYMSNLIVKGLCICLTRKYQDCIKIWGYESVASKGCLLHFKMLAVRSMHKNVFKTVLSSC